MTGGGGGGTCGGGGGGGGGGSSGGGGGGGGSSRCGGGGGGGGISGGGGGGGVFSPLTASIGASVGKTVSDGTQWLFGDKKTPEQRKMELALQQLRSGGMV